MKKLFLFIMLFDAHSMISSTVHVFGDSHAFFCFSNRVTRGDFDEKTAFCLTEFNEERCIAFDIHHMGPITMHRIGRDGLNVLNIQGVVHEGDTIVFVFGEIDVRCHIGKQRDVEQRALDEIIELLVSNYFATICKNVECYNEINVVVMAPVPPSDHGHTPVFPVYGSIKDRIDVNNALASRLNKACIEHKIHFLDIRDEFALQSGELNFELSDGIVHIGLPHNRIIKEKLFALIENKN